MSRFINFLKVWGPLSPKPLVGDNTGDYLMTQGAHAPKALHEFVGSHYPKDCRVAEHFLSVDISAVSALIGWLAPGARLPSEELPILENKRPPKLAKIRVWRRNESNRPLNPADLSS